MDTPATADPSPSDAPVEAFDEVTISIAAPPGQVYDLVSDISNMSRWSPETFKTQWLGGATGPKVGAKFRGWNKDGWVRWPTVAEIVAADPGREFAFDVKASGARWTYTFRATDTGCEVTERREQPHKPLGAKLFGLLLNQKERPGTLRTGMQQTLERIKAAAEQ
jgi:uncharacterized protein YndB with AHSA1/START domain